MKKKHFYILLVIIGLFLFINPVMAATTTTTTTIDNPCGENGVKLALRIVGYAIFAVKIIIPIVLIIYGTIDVAKAVVQGNDSLKKNLIQFAKRCIAAILVFMAPGVINGIFNLVTDDYGQYKDNDYKMCFTCLFEPNNCDVKVYGQTGE